MISNKNREIEFKNFILSEGHGDIPQNHPTLGKWVAKQRSRYKKGILEKEKIQSLEQFDKWQWNVLDATWDQKYSELCSYINEHKSIPPAKIPIGRWVLKQRERFKQNKLEKDRVNRLIKLKIWHW